MHISKVKPSFYSIKNEKISNDDENGTKLKFMKSNKYIFGLIRDNQIANREPRTSKQNEKLSRTKKIESNFNTGRWLPEEHRLFIEAFLKFGNNWRKVQKYVGSRSSSQARSHAQKFFVKIGRIEIENLQLDFQNNSLKSLNLMANKLNYDQKKRAIIHLNELVLDDKKAYKKSRIKLKIKSNAIDKSNCDALVNYSLFKKEELSTKSSKKKRMNFTKNCYKTIKKKNITFENISFEVIDKIRENSEILDEIETKEKEKNKDNNIPFLQKLLNPSSNRRNSIDLLCPTFNFINDNSLFLSNHSNRNTISNPFEEKEFLCIFENSNKFENQEHNIDQEKVQMLAQSEEKSHVTNSNSRSRRNSNEENSVNYPQYNFNTIDNSVQFMDPVM